jgi:uncharacterized membrane protein (DUF106 family)
MASPFDAIYQFFSQGWADVVKALATALGPAKNYPNCLILILLVCATMAIISAVATRALVDVETLRRKMAEVREWQTAYSKALRAKDQKQIDKLKKREQAIRNMSNSMAWNQFKPLIVTLVPFWLFYGIFNGVFGYNSIPVAYSPINIPYLPVLASGPTYFVFWTFYFLCSFGLTGIIQRVFNLPSVQD